MQPQSSCVNNILLHFVDNFCAIIMNVEVIMDPTQLCWPNLYLSPFPPPQPGLQENAEIINPPV